MFLWGRTSASDVSLRIVWSGKVLRKQGSRVPRSIFALYCYVLRRGIFRIRTWEKTSGFDISIPSGIRLSFFFFPLPWREFLPRSFEREERESYGERRRKRKRAEYRMRAFISLSLLPYLFLLPPPPFLDLFRETVHDRLSASPTKCLIGC